MMRRSTGECRRQDDQRMRIIGTDTQALGIPVKANAIPEGSRTAFRSEGEQQSERSDAGMVIVE
jgi:hypothetical protein